MKVAFESLTQPEARRFLWLYSKMNDYMNLNNEDFKEWKKLLNKVDYENFCLDQALPKYAEGKIASVGNNAWFVRWNGAKKKVDRIGFDLSEHDGLWPLEEGDIFSAWVKFDNKGHAISISAIRFLTHKME